MGDVDLAVSDGAWGTWPTTVQRSAAQVAGIWGQSPRTIRITVATDAELAASSDGIDADTVAVTNAQGDVLVAATADRTLTQVGREVVVAHELVHARLGQYGTDHTALWLKEGVAEWSATPTRGAPAVAQRWPNLVRAYADTPSRLAGPPPADVFAVDSKLAYEWAAAYVAYLVDVNGADQVKNLVASRPPDAAAAEGARRLDRHRGPKSFLVWLRAAFRA